MIHSIVNDKVILLNTGAITLSFLDVELALKLLLLSFSIIYTVIRTYKEVCKSKGDKTDS